MSDGYITLFWEVFQIDSATGKRFHVWLIENFPVKNFFKKFDATEKYNEKHKGFWVCEIDADSFTTSSYFLDAEGFPTVGYEIEAESVEDAEKMKEI